MPRFNLWSFLHESVFIILLIEGHNVFLDFDIAQTKTRYTRQPLVTNVSVVNLTVACVPAKQCDVLFEVLPPRECVHPFLH